MFIDSCYIEGFGKITNKKFDFSKGLNKIIGENGSGKTTLSVFIKVMLYGMSDTKKTGLEENDRKHYLPWNGGVCGGSLDFTVGRMRYRVERSFAPKAADDRFALYDLSTGKISGDYTENLGKELFGIDIDGFERTVFLSERNLTEAGKNPTVSAKLGGLVGCEGDIEGMDDAIKALEQERKRFNKKGGAGEISDTKKSVVEIEQRLLRLEEAEGALRTEEERLLKIKERLSVLKKEADRLLLLKEKAVIKKAEEIGEQRYLDLKRRLDADKAQLDSLKLFFSSGVPSYEEINEAAYKLTEARRITEQRSESPEYYKLQKMLSGIEKEELLRAKEAIEAIEKSRKMKALPEVRSFSATFSKRIPEEGELDLLILKAQAAEKKGLGLILAVLFLFLTALGGALGFFISPLCYSIAALGGVLLILLPILLKSSRRKRRRKIDSEICKLLDSIGEIDAEGGSPTSLLIYARDLLSRKGELMPPGEDEALLDVYHLIERAPEIKGDDLLTTAKLIIEKYEEYSSLSVFMRYKSNEETEERERAARLTREAKDFLLRFGEEGEVSFERLRGALREYERLSHEVGLMSAELCALEAKKPRVSENTDVPVEEDIKRDLALIEEETGRLSSERTLAERSIRSLSLSLEEREELVAEKEELLERLANSEEKYRIVMLTKELLEAAKDSMTARYLGKTKESFEKYTSLISGVEGAFELNTAFGVAKLEGGRARPSEAYSRGTRDLYSLASRLALIDSLYDSESPPIILDDPFVFFDDEKAKAALLVLSEMAKERQIIYFTCSESRSGKRN